MIRNNQNRRRRGGNNNGPRPQQMGGGNNYGNRLDNRQRGNASQLLEKYRALARDAQQAGDRVTAEYYLQYADHYYRVLGDYRDKAPDQGRGRRDNFDDDNIGYANGNDEADADEDEDGEARNDGPRGEARNDGPRGDDRNKWREDRPTGNRDQSREPRRENANRDGNRDREGGNRDREDGGREQVREPRREREAGNRDREGGSRERQPWNSERNRDGDRRDGDRRPQVERPAAAAGDEGPIPGLPGPATLRINRSASEDDGDARPARTLRSRAVTPEVVAEVPSEPVGEVEVAAPKRRGRPRKVVEDTSADA